MPTTDQLQAEINSLTGRINNHLAAIITLQQRCSRLENQVKDLKDQLSKVKKG